MGINKHQNKANKIMTLYLIYHKLCKHYKRIKIQYIPLQEKLEPNKFQINKKIKMNIFTIYLQLIYYINRK